VAAGDESGGAADFGRRRERPDPRHFASAAFDLLGSRRSNVSESGIQRSSTALSSIRLIFARASLIRRERSTFQMNLKICSRFFGRSRLKSRTYCVSLYVPSLLVVA